jgi:hypothetical protein
MCEIAEDSYRGQKLLAQQNKHLMCEQQLLKVSDGPQAVRGIKTLSLKIFHIPFAFLLKVLHCDFRKGL